MFEVRYIHKMGWRVDTGYIGDERCFVEIYLFFLIETPKKMLSDTVIIILSVCMTFDQYRGKRLL